MRFCCAVFSWMGIWIRAVDFFDGPVSVSYTHLNKPAQTTIGLIPVDSIYTPVYKVNYTVENTRVGLSLIHI